MRKRGLAFLSVLYLFLAAPTAFSKCGEPTPILDSTIDISSSQAATYTPLYLKKDLLSDLYPGLKVQIQRRRASPGILEARFSFDDGLLSTDYLIYKIRLALLDDNSLVDSAEADFSDGCENPAGHGIRAGEFFTAAKIPTRSEPLRLPRLRIQVWGEMF